MPQKRNPVALEHARAIGSKALGQVSAIMLSVHNTPFGDIVDTEDDLQPLVAAMFRDATRAVTLVGASMREADFDVARMADRAGAGGTTLTELADHLVREHGVPFRTAHAIAGRLSASCQVNEPAALAAMLRDAARDALGVRARERAVEITATELTKILSPRHFIDVRRTPGGPSPIETSRATDAASGVLDADRAWVARTRAATAAADERLRARSRSL
jgi:argininosuccinate lyase